MNQLTKKHLPKNVKYGAWVVLTAYTLAHILPYVPKYTVPHADLLNVLAMINYIYSPDLFQGDYLTQAITYYNVMTAPIYFYGIIYPLNFLFSSRWVLFIIGIVITLGSTYFAGERWKTWMDLLIASTILIILLHVYLNPLEGQRRSFTSFFLLSLFWMEPKSNYLWELFFVALSAGVYPPVTLIMVLYLCIGKFHKVLLGEKNWRTPLLESLGFGIVMIAVLSPYLLNILFAETETLFSTLLLDENYYTETSFFNVFLFGTRTALFKNTSHFDIFFILSFIFVIESLLLRQKISFHLRYMKLLISGLTLWVLAHLLHPVIYHPFKYTRLTLVLGLAFPVIKNLPAFTQTLHSKTLGKISLKFSSMIVSTGILGILAALISQNKISILEKLPVWGIDGWKFLLALPIFLTVLVMLMDFLNSVEIVCLISIVLLLFLIYIPHDFYYEDAPIFSLRGLTFQDFDPLYNFLLQTPPRTMVAGPPLFYMDPIPAFAKRPVFISYHGAIFSETCERIDQFWKAYFSDTLSSVSTFMKKNDIDYILLDREVFRGDKRYIPGFSPKKCESPNREEIREILGTRNPALDRHFPDADWSKNRRLYLLHRKILL